MKEGKDFFLKPPIFCNVDTFETYGITCAIYTSLEEKNRVQGKRLCQKILVDVLRENGIYLAHEYLPNSGIEEETK